MSDPALWLLGPPPVQVDLATPVVRADDVGLLRGESVFETMRVVGGRAAFVDLHLARLPRSAARLDLDLPTGWPDLVDAAAAAWGPADASLRLVCTKGGTAFALVSAVPGKTVREREQGLTVTTLPLGVAAGHRADAPWLLGGVKSTSYAVNMASLRAVDTDDAIWVSSDGEVLEAPTATVAWVTAGRLVTPPAAEVSILPGTTMDVVLDLCGQQGVPVEVRRGTAQELAAADEVMLCSSVRGVAPVVALDGRELGVGPVTARLRDAFEAAVAG